MSSPVSTITSNVNLLLLDTYAIVNSNQPYIAYVSSVATPGKIATVRDSTGNLGTNFYKIRVSTTKGVSFVDGTNFFDITQPFGYVTMSSRDKNTWTVLNAYAFPDPYGISYVSTLNVRDRLATPNIFATNFMSTVQLNTVSISSFNLQVSNNIFTTSISSFNIQATNVSTNSIFANNISTNSFRANTISTLSLNVSSMNVYKISTNTIDASVINIDNFTVNNQLNVENNIFTIGLRAANGFFSNSLNTFNLKISDSLTNTQIQNKNSILYIGNTLDMSSNSIQNIDNLYTSTINISSINNQDVNFFGGINWSYNKAVVSVDICGQELQNIQQTNKRKDAATNFGLAVSYDERNNRSDYIEKYPQPFRQVLLNQLGYTYLTINPSPFNKYITSFQFTSSNFLNSNFGTLWVYAGLSNGTNNTEYFGKTYNSNTPYQININLFTATQITTFDYQDIISFSNWSDGQVVYPVLYAVCSEPLGTDGIFENYTFTYTLQPVFDSLV